jgi:hypothetical protein
MEGEAKAVAMAAAIRVLRMMRLLKEFKNYKLSNAETVPDFYFIINPIVTPISQCSIGDFAPNRAISTAATHCRGAGSALTAVGDIAVLDFISSP